MFSKRPREHVLGPFPLSLYVCHFGELLEDGGSGQKEAGLFEIFELQYTVASSTFLYMFLDTIFS